MSTETVAARPVPAMPRVAPPVDVYENRDAVILAVDVPGVVRDNLTIEIEGDELLLTARQGELPKGEALHLGFAPVEFRRAFRVPRGLDSSNVSAALDNGVLRITLPKSDAIRPRRIAVA
jgi:HSP20 family molecular chaperone IbpA